MKLKKLFMTGCLAAMTSISALAAGWPSNYQGVMLQGFYWDSYTDTKWTNLTSQADELSESFDLIWVPNSAYSGGHQTMGYMPIYWFTNHNSSFGTETQLKTMITTFAQKGTGFIADVVINHRNGVSNWYDFPSENWNGKTWKLGLSHICANDEMAWASGQPKPTGANDTGENFDGARDLDHTNATVQDNCKNYVKCLLEKYGYVGFRYDMAKGYSGYYNKIYNQYANPTFSVGEYWDGSYDAVAAWIEATGKTSAAFDFPCKYAINDAFSSGDMRKLVWKANGTNDQPAGMIHFGYPQYAVTFIDNHDTYRDDWNKFNGNVVAANAFILMSPGTPCVFLPHWKEHKAAIKQLIAVRKAAGLHNQSAVRVLRSTSDCYMAEVTGTKGKVVVKVGPAMVSPDGWSDSQIRAVGTDYCVWANVDVQGGGDDPITYGPDKLYLLGNIKNNSWDTARGLAFDKDGSTYTLSNVSFEAAPGETYCYFNLCTTLGANWDVINGSTRYGSVNEGDRIVISQPADMTTYSGGNAGNCKSWTVLPGTYNLTVDFKEMTLTVNTASTGVDTVGEEPEGKAAYYTLQGVRLDAPVKGQPVIVVRGGKTSKMIAY